MTSLMTVLLRGFLRGRVSVKSASEGTASGNSSSAAGLNESCFWVRDTMSENEPGVWTLMRSCISFGDGESGSSGGQQINVGLLRGGPWWHRLCRRVVRSRRCSDGQWGRQRDALRAGFFADGPQPSHLDKAGSASFQSHHDKKIGSFEEEHLYVGGSNKTVFCDDSRVRQHGDVSPTSEAWRYG